MSKVRKFLLTVVCLAVCAATVTACAPLRAEAAVKVGVANFANRNKSKLSTAEQAIYDERIQEASDTLAELLSASAAIDVVGRQKVAGAAEAQKAIEAGRAAGCQYMVIGAITNIEFRTGYKVSGNGLSVLFGGTSKSETNQQMIMTVETRVVDVSNGKVILSLSKNGVGNYSGTETHGFSAKVIKESMKKAEANFYAMWTQASLSAASQHADRIREVLAGEFACIDSVDGKNVTVNRGRQNGVISGDVIRVFAEGEEIRDLDGKLLGRDIVTLALLMVNDAHSESCRAGVIGGNISAVRKGDRAEIISLTEADELLRKNSFPKDRPASAPSAPQQFSALKHAGLENESTDPSKVIASYGLPSGEANARRIAHINIGKLKDKKAAIAKYAELVSSYSGDYLAAFRAAELSLAVKDTSGGKQWIDKALSVNPNYKPALKLQSRIK